jgi:NAD(P)H-nitrite reductase large subunit
MNEERENYEICHCMKVTFADVANALHNSKTFTQVEDAFADVQKATKCSTGCGGCHDEIMRTISELMG